MTRDPESVRCELDYLRAASEDVASLNELILRTADALMEAPGGLITLAIAAPPHVAQSVEQVGEAVRDTMKALLAMQEPVGRLIALLDGRTKALREESGL